MALELLVAFCLEEAALVLQGAQSPIQPDGASATCLGKLFQYFTTLILKRKTKLFT